MSDQPNPFSSDVHTAQYAGNANTQPPAPRKSNAWIWIIGGLVLGGIGLAACCGSLAIFGFTSAVAGLKAPVNAAVESLNGDPAVAAKLGPPIRSSTGFGVNEYSNQNGNGGAEVNFTAVGRNGSAEVSGRMDLTAGVWSPGSLTIRCEDGTELTVP